MTDISSYLPPQLDALPATNTPDVRSMMVSEYVRDRLLTIGAGQPRSLQANLGPSEIGQACARRLAYRIAGTPMVNLPDPTKALLGTGFHSVVADGFKAMDPSGRRYLIEHWCAYRGIGGSVDLFDRFRHTAFDWKTTAKRRISQYRRDGVPSNSSTQLHIYGQALIAEGEQVDTLALVYIPRDGDLDDIWSWTTTPDRAKADEAIDRYEGIKQRLTTQGPEAFDAKPGPLCGYCPNYRPNATDLAVACPGKGIRS